MNDIPPTPAEPVHRRRGWPMSDEHKQKMAEGRRRAKEARQARPKPAQDNPVPKQWTAGNYLTGLTGGEGWNSKCTDLCNPKQGCVITRGDGSGNCGHPEKGGLQAADLLRPKVVERYNEARRYLAHQKADRR
jgi:hypothetical protein